MGLILGGLYVGIIYINSNIYYYIKGFVFIVFELD